MAQAPLRRIVDRPSQMVEVLECGHRMARPLGLGENAQQPSKAKSRRCFQCAESAQIEVRERCPAGARGVFTGLLFPQVRPGILEQTF